MFNIYILRNRKMKVKNFEFKTMNQMETLQETCYRLSDKVIERAKEGKQISKEAMKHNFERILEQLEKMNLLKK